MRKPDGPTARIIELARSAPGGLIRWHEAESEYVDASEAARRHYRRGERNHHIWLKQVLDRHFIKVEGIDGYYILAESIGENDPLDHVIVNNFNRDFGFVGSYGSNSAPPSWPLKRMSSL